MKMLNEQNYLSYYDQETYLFETVHTRFHQQDYLSAFDFFYIIIWKANRAKSKMAKKLLDNCNHNNLEDAVHELTSTLAQIVNNEEKLRYMMEHWKFALPMASAVLAVLYPEDFTIYDVRVCDSLKDKNFRYIGNLTSFDDVWREYTVFKEAVKAATPPELNLRDKDRYLWGKSFHKQLQADISNCFNCNK